MKTLSKYEYLGNSLVKINENFNEMNVRVDNLYSEKQKWDGFFTLIQSISSNIQHFVNTIPGLTGNWKETSDLVYNVKGFWEEPILVVYPKTFNMVGNYLEVQTFLNENFSCDNFSPTQLLKCDFLCKNYNPDKFQLTPYIGEKRPTLEAYAKQYSVTIEEVYSYLSYLNQIKSVTNVLNSLFLKVSQRDLVVADWRDVQQYENYVSYDYTKNEFFSTEVDMEQYDLKFFYSYIVQYKSIYTKLNNYISKKIDTIPQFILDQFTNRSIEVFIGGTFYFKNINNSWELFPYYGNEYCAGSYCFDCYSSINVNDLYNYEKPCYNSFEYLLDECYGN